MLRVLLNGAASHPGGAAIFRATLRYITTQKHPKIVWGRINSYFLYRIATPFEFQVIKLRQ